MASTFHRLCVRDIRKETDECVSIAFEVPANLADAFTYIAGQHLTLRTRIDGEAVRRSYSICTAPSENDLRIAIKRVPNGRFSTYAHEILAIGDEIDVMPPAGRFFSPLDTDRSKRYLAIAAGSGITPVIALVKSVLENEPQSEITLIYGNKNRSSVIFKDELAALKNRFIDRFSLFHVFSREPLESPLLEGRIDPPRLSRFFDYIVDKSRLDEVFICGPEPMMLALRESLLSKDFSRKQVHFELFGTGQSERDGPSPRDRAPGAAGSKSMCRVTVKVDGASTDLSVPYRGLSILDAALCAGADLPYACKGGVCTTCRARLEAGEVEMDVNYGLEPEEVAAGFILTCQSHPRTEQVVVNYDTR